MAFTPMAAGIGAHHGFVTYDYDQSTHAHFVAAVGPGGPTGCCLALVIEWFRHWLQARPGGGLPVWGGYEQYVNSVAGAANVALNTNAINLAGGGWPAAADVAMGGVGGGVAAMPPGGLQAGPAYVAMGLAAGPAFLGPAAALNSAALQPIPAAARCTILIAAGAGGSHAMGILRTGQSLYYFDPNHGEIRFPSATDFANWFFSGYSAQTLAAVVGVAGGGFGFSRLLYS